MIRRYRYSCGCVDDGGSGGTRAIAKRTVLGFSKEKVGFG